MSIQNTLYYDIIEIFMQTGILAPSGYDVLTSPELLNVEEINASLVLLAQVSTSIDVSSKLDAVSLLRKDTFFASNVDSTILILQNKCLEELFAIEKIIFYAEQEVGTFHDNKGFVLLENVIEKLYAFKILLPFCQFTEISKFSMLLFRVISIFIYFKIPYKQELIDIARFLNSDHAHNNKRYYPLFLEILLYHSTHFAPESTDEIFKFIEALNNAKPQSTEDSAFIWTFKGLLYSLLGECNTSLTCYENYILAPQNSCPFLHEFFSIRISVDGFYMGKFHISYGIIESFRNTAEYVGKSYVAVRWCTHLAFLFLHRQDYDEALRYINSSLTFLEKVNAPVPTSIARRAHALYFFVVHDYERAAEILRLDCQLSTQNDALIVPPTDFMVLDMFYQLEHYHKLDIGAYGLDKILPAYLKNVNHLTRGTALRIKAQLADEDEKYTQAHSLFQRAFEDIIHTGCSVPIENTGKLYIEFLQRHQLHEEIENVQKKIGQFNRSAHDPLATSFNPSNPFPFSQNFLLALFHRSVQEENSRSLHQLLTIVQRELDSQRVAFFIIKKAEQDDIRHECISSVNITSIEMKNFSLDMLKNDLNDYLDNHSQTPNISQIGNTALAFLFPNQNNTCYLLYLENKLTEGLYIKMGQSERQALAWILYSEIRQYSVDLHPQHDASTDQRQELSFKHKIPPYWGDDMNAILEKAQCVAQVDATILITGETGSGKEQFARYIHQNGNQDSPFICVHLASISEELFESELFGHEKGAFTGAIQQKKGYFELAHNGIIFLDEIADVSLRMQVKLLRVLQEKQFARVGGTTQIHSNFRIITATNKNLWQEVREGRFREDLMYRISMIPLNLPPLRNRTRDLPQLINHLHHFFTMKHSKKPEKISTHDQKKLCAHKWYGNIRELCNVLEKYVILGVFEIDSIHSPLQTSPDTSIEPFTALPTLVALEKQYLHYVLEYTQGKIYGKRGALEILDMKKSTFYNRIEQYELGNLLRR